ncbi:MAG: hypothetical protein ACI9UV_002375 [Algoriphagus sp.]|jgi:hypothetical protein|tara:strand:+ start:354 stop:647 length:294 start_codon:yes stop_codon:yes gene_type:complete
MKMDNRIDKVLASIEGIERAQAPAGAFDKIQQKILAQKIEERKLNPLQWLGAAAAIALIVVGNFIFITSYQNQEAELPQSKIYSELISDFNIYADEN